MANTIVKGAHGISITFDGNTAWDSTTDYPDGLDIDSILFIPTATDDALIVYDTTASGRQLVNYTAATAYDHKIKYFSNVGHTLKPYVAAAGVSANVIMIIELR